MNVRITPRGHVRRTVLYSGIRQVLSDGRVLALYRMTSPYAPTVTGPIVLVLTDIAEIALDDDGAVT